MIFVWQYSGLVLADFNQFKMLAAEGQARLMTRYRQYLRDGVLNR